MRRLVESRKQIEDDERELLSLMELMPVGVAWADDGIVRYVNKSFVEQFGYSLKDIPSVKEWFLKAYPDEGYRHQLAMIWQKSMDEHLNSGVPIPPFVANVTRKDGTDSRVIVNTHISRQRVMVIFTDITEQEKRQEEQIRQQKLESIGVLAGGIAHDFNNVLTAIIGNISFAELFIEEGHKARMPLDQAAIASKRAAELAHQLLTFARGGQPVTSSVAPRQLIEESLSLVLHGTNVKGEIEADADLYDIEADAGQISQVCNNLIINAVQAMPGGGTIRISAANARVAAGNIQGLPEGEYVRLVFSDQGCGMPEEMLKSIFDPYFTTKPTGSGLGLASVQSIVARHGGHVAVSSRPGRGTTFEILLPAARLPESTGSVKPEDQFQATSVAKTTTTLLVMDDEEMIRNMAAAMLGSLGYQVTTCASGEEAIALYKQASQSGKPFAGVIMDLTIPGGMGGQEAARIIRGLDSQAYLIVSSGYCNDPVMSDFRSYGFNAAVRKPYTVSELTGVLKVIGG